MSTKLIENATIFRRLHDSGELLVLPNAWDAASARIIEQAGAKAIATTSAGMAWSLGYADGEQLPLNELLAASARIGRVVSVRSAWTSSAATRRRRQKLPRWPAH